MTARVNRSNLNQALRERGREAVIQLNTLPVTEMPMVLTLDQLRPNPDNPRSARNPKYEDIKASIRARGLDTVPKVTKNPGGEDVYIFSDGGNTRYQILKELWEESRDERFFRLYCLFKPWPGRLQCVIGHLAENEVRGELTFIEKALGIHKARQIYEEQLNKKVSLRELATLLTTDGLPVHYSSISKMMDTIKYLYPCLPALLSSGLGRHQIQPLLNLRHDAEKLWQAYESGCEAIASFDEVFSQCCSQFDSPELWGFELFRDELTGRLLQALPHPSLNYDRWMLELDPKAHNHRQLFGETQLAIPEDASDVSSSPHSEQTLQHAAVNDATVEKRETNLEESKASSVKRRKDNPVNCVSAADTKPLNQHKSPYQEEDQTFQDETIDHSLPFLPDEDDDELPHLHTASAESIPDSACTIWSLSVLDDDIEHLQGIIWKLVFELAESQGCEHELLPDSRTEQACGFQLADNTHPSAFNQWLLSLAGESASAPDILRDLLIGSPERQPDFYLDDEDCQKLLRLLRVLRRLRQWQRQMYPGGE